MNHQLAAFLQCGDIHCKRTCTSEELYCLVLDDNGYVIVSDDREDTGRFFGEIRADIMAQLIEEGVYKPNRMYDYQATCFRSTDTGNPASRCLTVRLYTNKVHKTPHSLYYILNTCSILHILHKF